ncbi:hypothetical protein DOY81_009573, partial [Sarcophaga bullata]
MSNTEEKMLRFSKIINAPSTPIQMFKHVIGKLETHSIMMNLATVDKDYGVLNRTVIYRGLTPEEEETNQHIRFVTEKNSHKYQSLKADPKVSVTMVLNMPNEIWQIRLFNAEAVELPNEALKSLWQDEPLLAKMRSVVCECGRPNEGVEELECRYQELYKQYESEGKKEPEQTETYTAFKIIPKHWDFYFS